MPVGFQILVESLDHEDSYIYLSAIRGLSALGSAFTDRLLPLLVGRFSSSNNNNIEFRLKLGEAIVRILKDLGQLTYQLNLTFYYGQFQKHRSGGGGGSRVVWLD